MRGKAQGKKDTPVKHGHLVLGAWLALGSYASAQQNLANYYVNGRTGMDVPGYGRSPATPWKTMTYAMTQIPPVVNPVNWNTLYVEGDQAYAPGTNGETLPVRPAYNLWIEGTFVGHGRMPIIAVGAGGTGFEFDPNVVYNRNQSTMRYLVFEGGRYGMKMGASGTRRHRPRIQDCTFRGQSAAGVRIDEASSSVGVDPRFFQTLFTQAPRGIEVVSSGGGAVVRPDVEECTLVGLTDAAIHLDDTSASGNVGGLFRSNWFRECNRGVHVRSGPVAMTTNFEVYSCSFTDITQEAVLLEAVRPADPSALVQLSSFLRCGDGVRFQGFLTPGAYSLTLLGNVMQGCRRNGVLVDLIGAGTCRFDLSGNTIVQCGTGVGMTLSSPSIAFTLRSHGDRFLGNTNGVSLLGTSATSSMAITSAMVCGSSARGLDVSGNTPFAAHGLTLADNGTALNAPAGAQLDHCVFSGNGTDVVGSPSITYSCFHQSSYAGTGNLNTTDPLLVRPLYKLAPTSPCVDAGNASASLPETDYEGDPRASIGRAGGSATPDMGADEYVLTGSARKYGLRGFGYYNFFPQIGSPSTQVVIGGNVVVALSDAILPVFGVPANDAFLTLGLRDDPGGLPFDLGVIGAPGSLLWNELTTVVGLFPVSRTGTAQLTVPIPNAPLLVGHTFTFQWFANQRSANPRGPVASDGLRVTIGQ